MARVTVEDCVQKVPNRFELVLFAAQRARNISRGEELKIERDNDKNPVVALREIAEEKVDLLKLEQDLVKSLSRAPEPEPFRPVRALAPSPNRSSQRPALRSASMMMIARVAVSPSPSQFASPLAAATHHPSIRRARSISARHSFAFGCGGSCENAPATATTPSNTKYA